MEIMVEWNFQFFIKLHYGGVGFSAQNLNTRLRQFF